MLQQISNIVVLMLENRSFDQMLGFSGVAGVDGLTENETNPLNGVQVPITRLTGTNGYITTPDPPHEYPDTSFHIYGTDKPDATSQPIMKGFVQRYADTYKLNATQAQQVMTAFSAEQLPTLTFLARRYVVCDRWFSSVPGPTWPNRWFSMCGTSNGRVDSPTSWESAKDFMFHAMPMRSIFDACEAAHVSWRVYCDDYSFSATLKNVPRRGEAVVGIPDFFDDAASGRLPSFSWVEPDYFFRPQCQHPPHDVRAGEALIADVYNALRNGKQWARTLFVLTWDEHGGFYDHVAPPLGAVPPAEPPSGPYRFSFQRYGIRVPALLISPFTAGGPKDSTLYDHTSILATVRARFGLGDLGPRVAAANTFQRPPDPKPHSDLDAGVEIPKPKVIESPAVTGLDDLHRSILMSAIALRHGSLSEVEAVHVVATEFGVPWLHDIENPWNAIVGDPIGNLHRMSAAAYVSDVMHDFTSGRPLKGRP